MLSVFVVRELDLFLCILICCEDRLSTDMSGREPDLSITIDRLEDLTRGFGSEWMSSSEFGVT